MSSLKETISRGSTDKIQATQFLKSLKEHAAELPNDFFQPLGTNSKPQRKSPPLINSYLGLFDLLQSLTVETLRDGTNNPTPSTPCFPIFF